MILSSCSKKKQEPSFETGCDLFEECADPIDSSLALTFKEKYENLNDTQTSSGAINRSVSIAEDHPFVRESGNEILKKIQNKETFYLYIGDELCPWCRSVIEKAIEIAKLAQIKTIYSIEIWNDQGEEIFRDKYIYENEELKKIYEGDPSYFELLAYFDDFLQDYTLLTEEKEIQTGEKRIFAPSFFYIEEGIPKRMCTGISPLQNDSREELSEAILEDESKLFKAFFAVQ